MIEIQQVLMAVVSALVYSLVFYAKKRANDDPEGFNKFKLGATMLVGAGVGIAYGLSGIDFGQQEISNQLVAYTGTVALVESILKTVWRMYLKKLFADK